ncbi:MAG: hypothetical protein KME03_08575 [Aphanocapsa lilacina HA4352-LM1]|jgi:hypothetical protein|nr:hypothetical protein [Aphanocapsa lilacina HA4352-LM1]
MGPAWIALSLVVWAAVALYLLFTGIPLVQALPAMLLALLLYGIGVVWIWWKGPKPPPSKDTPK